MWRTGELKEERYHAIYTRRKGELEWFSPGRNSEKKFWWECMRQEWGSMARYYEG
jgi:hypothetical protein